MKITKKTVISKIENVMDPELHISIVDLGLIQKVVVTDKKVTITMTLTSIGCPLFSVIEKQIQTEIQTLGIPKENIHIILSFEKPWSMDDMTKNGKAMLGL